jgi:GT2 family glycosyltransferase
VNTHLAIVIVSWNVRDLLRRCLHAVEASLHNSGISYSILVVDNASSDGTPAMLRADFPHVRLLEPGYNTGFVGGNNLAMRVLGLDATPPRPDHAQYPPPALVLLLNPDTEPQGDALAQLARYLEAHPQAVAVGPRLCYADGSTQSSRRRFPSRLTFFWESTPLERLWSGNPWARRYHCANQDDAAIQPVDWLVGAALMVRGTTIMRAGLLDERFFMYSEELEWQHRLRHAAHGAAVVYLPSAVITHHEARSSEQVPLTRHLHFNRSRVLLAQMWYGSLFARGLRSFLLLCYLWELLVESGKHLLGHRRDLRRQRIGVYAAVISRL